jgi:hypothetical protein
MSNKKKRKNKQKFEDNIEDIRKKETRKNKKRANRHIKKKMLKDLEQGMYDDITDYDYFNK